MVYSEAIIRDQRFTLVFIFTHWIITEDQIARKSYQTSSYDIYVRI